MTRSFNLIPESVLARRRAKRRTRRWILCGALYAVCIGMGMGAIELGELQRRDDRAAEIAQIEERIALLEQEIKAADHERRALGLAVDAGRVSAERPAWSTLLAVLGALRGDGVVLDSCRLDVGHAPTDAKTPNEKVDEADGPLDEARRVGFELELRGAGLTQADVTGFALRLEELGIFERVSLTQMDRGARFGHSVIQFRLVATLRGKGAHS